MTWSLERILKGAAKLKASDVHLVRGSAPVFRVDGEICAIEGEPLDEPVLRAIFEGRRPPANGTRSRRTGSSVSRGTCRALGGCGRAFTGRDAPNSRFACAKTRSARPKALGLPPIIEELTRRPSGLILVTGPTGVGKTTTMNFMVDAINRQRRLKIVTIEDPIEFVHQNARSMVIQQEVTTDVKDYRSALIHVLRRIPM